VGGGGDNVSSSENNVCKCPVVGWSMVHSGNGKVVHMTEEEKGREMRMSG
jgi:hypothetical protein